MGSLLYGRSTKQFLVKEAVFFLKRQNMKDEKDLISRLFQSDVSS